jgi:NDP-sugar pyrophosphorylase family protein
MKAVILAGGLGKRLRPFTEVIPKPLLPIGDGERAIIEVQIEHLKANDFTDIYIATNYKSKYIESYLGDGSNYGVRLYYNIEKKRMGTVGPLTLLHSNLNEPFLLMNGDILTKANFKSIYRTALGFPESMLTVVTKDILTPFRFGNVETDGDYIIGVQEKPDLKLEILAGIYILKPKIFSYIPKNKRYDMNELIVNLLDNSEKITKYKLESYWIDIGQYDDYKQAKSDYKKIWE